MYTFQNNVETSFRLENIVICCKHFPGIWKSRYSDHPGMFRVLFEKIL